MKQTLNLYFIKYQHNLNVIIIFKTRLKSRKGVHCVFLLHYLMQKKAIKSSYERWKYDLHKDKDQLLELPLNTLLL